MDIAMLVIPKPPPGSRVVMRIDPAPAFVGEGSINYICGNCGDLLAEHLEQASQLQDIVIQCPTCSAYNETRT